MSNDSERSRTYAAGAKPFTPSVETAPTDAFAIGRTRSPRTRRTVDLSSTQHRALDMWQRDTADRLGLARVTGQEVLAALVDQLLIDPRLSSQITRTIWNRR